jgi:hypothetical protein
MTLKNYQASIDINKLYSSIIKVPSGLSEALKPRITSIGATVNVYGSEEEPAGLTLANINDKMALISAEVSLEVFDGIPNYLAFTSSGTPTELVISCIDTSEIQTIS